ncbi:DEAD/DEAH box helicase family protein [Nocardia tengchongensis]|uniref:DEAD/DEAH box helicase family protein n=1 Tax=Nocardia tengchongensis TaxID=2055889 RepID=UPI0036A0094D
MRTLIIVPSDALRTQIAEKFVTLGILPSIGAVTGEFLCPTVLVLKHGLETSDPADELTRRANVIVTTAHALNSCSPQAREALAAACERLFVDEAHHMAARTWRSVAEMFRKR